MRSAKYSVRSTILPDIRYTRCTRGDGVAIKCGILRFKSRCLKQDVSEFQILVNVCRSDAVFMPEFSRFRYIPLASMVRGKEEEEEPSLCRSGANHLAASDGVPFQISFRNISPFFLGKKKFPR